MIGKIMYGAVTLDLSKINDVVRTPIFDDSGTDYVCTQHDVDVICTLNSEATSYINLVNNVPQAGKAYAGRTDRILSDYLSTPRRVLKMWAYDFDGSRVTYLESPPQGQGRVGALPSDVRNGPKCTVFAVHGADVHGAKTWVLHLRFTTWINNCLDGSSPILSHRWERNVDYDDQYRAIATTRGTVIFNVGRLWGSGFSPDHFRSQFFQPPADNMARAHVNVQIAADNCTAHYTVVDGERFASLGTTNPLDASKPHPATNLEADLQTWYTQGSAYAALAQTAPVIWNEALQAVGPGGLVDFLWRPFAAGGRVGVALAGNLQSQLPTYFTKISVRAHGARNSARGDLAKLCFAVAFSRLGNPSFFSMANRSEFVMMQRLHDSYVELSMTLSFKDQIFTQLAGIAGPPGAIGAALGLLLANDNGRRYMEAYFPVQNAADDPTGNNTYVRPPDHALPLNLAGELLQELRDAAANIRAAVANPPDFPPGPPLLSNKPIGNHPMNNNPAQGGATHNRGIGYMKALITQALLGQCPTIPLPTWDGNLPASASAPSVPAVNVPLLPRS